MDDDDDDDDYVDNDKYDDQKNAVYTCTFEKV
jgi:hypothetical protein